MTTWNFKNTYCNLPQDFFSATEPEKSSAPRLLLFNHELAKMLGCGNLDPNNDVEFFCGNKLWPGAFPLAQAYLGHQFGHLNRLGDGRALLLGEHVTAEGRRYDIQLKGSGRTPYSRGGDGRAALGPMLREYIMSEALHHLGIPTSRSLAVVATGDHVYREQALPGAVLVRVASSHIRIGTFQYAALATHPTNLKIFTDYVIQRHDPEVLLFENPYLEFLKNVIQRQANLIAQWMSIGFIHGVMNTDNMMISGETLDYGPCAFLDEFDPTKAFSSIDQNGRYAYANQPSIAQWNLTRFAEALLPLIDPSTEKGIQLAENELKKFELLFEKAWFGILKNKLGLIGNFSEDQELIRDLLSAMHKNQLDWTNTFVKLGQLLSAQNSLDNGSIQTLPSLHNWIPKWLNRIEKENTEKAIEAMKSTNPLVIPRNRIVEEVLNSAVSDNNFEPLNDFVVQLRSPFQNLEKTPQYQDPGKSFSKNFKTFCGT